MDSFCLLQCFQEKNCLYRYYTIWLRLLQNVDFHSSLITVFDLFVSWLLNELSLFEIRNLFSFTIMFMHVPIVIQVQTNKKLNLSTNISNNQYPIMKDNPKTAGRQKSNKLLLYLGMTVSFLVGFPLACHCVAMLMDAGFFVFFELELSFRIQTLFNI